MEVVSDKQTKENWVWSQSGWGAILLVNCSPTIMGQKADKTTTKLLLPEEIKNLFLMTVSVQCPLCILKMY